MTGTQNTVAFVTFDRDENGLPDFASLKNLYTKLHELMQNKKIISSKVTGRFGIAQAVASMCFGNGIGFAFAAADGLLAPENGAFVLELAPGVDASALEGLNYRVIGHTLPKEAVIKLGSEEITLSEAQAAWMEKLEAVFPTKTADSEKTAQTITATGKAPAVYSGEKFAAPRVFIPVFPGTNCEYDTAQAFARAGAVTDVMVLKNLTSADCAASLAEMAKRIANSQIVMLPGGFSGGDEPDGSGKFIAAALRNPAVKDAVMNLLKNRDGLMLGICNGFQALIKLGLVPFGEIRDIESGFPTLTYNTIGRHASCMVRTRVSSTLSPWLAGVNTGDVHAIAISHGEGRFIASEDLVQQMIANGQVATQYVDLDGNASMDIRYNPNGSVYAIEGITSPDGRVFGKMGHSERYVPGLFQNIPDEKDQKLFASGVGYFR